MDNIDCGFWRDLCFTNGVMRHYDKGECIIRSGESARICGWVCKGYFKYTVCGSTGECSVTGFAFKESPVADFLGVVSGGPSPCDVVAGMASDVVVVGVALMRDFLYRNPQIDISASHAVMHQLYSQYLSFFRLTPAERYSALLHRCPELLQTISLKELASYLNVTPQHLCRIRRRVKQV